MCRAITGVSAIGVGVLLTGLVAAFIRSYDVRIESPAAPCAYADVCPFSRRGAAYRAYSVWHVFTAACWAFTYGLMENKLFGGLLPPKKLIFDGICIPALRVV